MKKTLKLPSFLHFLFWDVDISKLDLKKDMRYVIERVLEYGDIKEVDWLFSTYSKDDVVYVLKESKRISEKTGNFFYIILDLNESRDSFQCLNKPYTQRQNRF